MAAVGGGWAIAFDAVTYLFAAFCMTRLRVTHKITGRASVLRGIREGWTGFRSMPWVWTIVLSLCVTYRIRADVTGALVPEIAVHSFGSWSRSSASRWDRP